MAAAPVRVWAIGCGALHAEAVRVATGARPVAICDGEGPPFAGIDGLRGPEVVAAAPRSHDEGREVALNPSTSRPR